MARKLAHLYNEEARTALLEASGKAEELLQQAQRWMAGMLRVPLAPPDTKLQGTSSVADWNPSGWLHLLVSLLVVGWILLDIISISGCIAVGC